MAYIGDTVRLKVKFLRFDSVLIDPVDMQVKIYDGDTRNLIDTITMGVVFVSQGNYYYDYIVPDGVSEFIVVEFSGLYNGKPILARDKIRRVFA